VLNERLQAALTPTREGLAERRFGGRIYRVGDKVMQLRNNYDKGTAGVFNGSVGVITALSLEDSELRVLLDEDEEVAYGFDELDELTHAYGRPAARPARRTPFGRPHHGRSTIAGRLCPAAARRPGLDGPHPGRGC
jgi:hypothetical protein